MLKSNVGYSTETESYLAGQETATKAQENLVNPKLGFLFTSVKNDLKEVIKGVQSTTKAPIIGCTSSGAIIVPDGIITSDNGFAGMLMLDDENLNIGLACHEAGKDARAIGRKVAIQAVQNAKSTRAPAYFYMVASPRQEEEYLMGIQDVIGRVPMFGGSAADDTVEGKWKIICNDKVFTDGVAVAFFYTDSEIVTSFTGAYRETNNIGLITEVEDDRTLVSIDGISALKKYATWLNVPQQSLQKSNLLAASITRPLGVKDPLGNLTVVRHPMFGNDMGTRTTADDTITLGNKVVPKTAIIQLEATVDELINSTGTTLKDVKKQLYADPAAYVLIHCGGRKLGIGNRLAEVHSQLVKEAKGVPFITVFTFGEYGYDEHSSNICGGLMLSFTAFGKN
ncbi:MAG: FIST N-terminal domain-containing protein [Mycoplasmatota bacterium]|nr:FIST N-terminal domain-containing protein [Mycoplasmatota bacterium]